jgi:hypothetical protein
MVVPKTSVPLLKPAADLSLIRPCDHTGWLSGAAMPWPSQILRWAVTSGTPEAESPRLVTRRRKVLATSDRPGLQLSARGLCAAAGCSFRLLANGLAGRGAVGWDQGRNHAIGVMNASQP